MSAAAPPGARPGSRRGWGWHPLVDEWAARIVTAAEIRPGELVVDLGAGTGALTRPLLLTGARVLAVELHPGRARRLRELCPRATVVEVDVHDFRWPTRPFRVVASPPYALSSVLLRELLGRHSHLVGADLVLQRAVVRRFAEDSMPSARARPAGRWLLRTGMSLPRRAFRPPPQVDSAVLVIRRR